MHMPCDVYILLLCTFFVDAKLCETRTCIYEFLHRPRNDKFKLQRFLAVYRTTWWILLCVYYYRLRRNPVRRLWKGAEKCWSSGLCSQWLIFDISIMPIVRPWVVSAEMSLIFHVRSVCLIYDRLEHAGAKLINVCRCETSKTKIHYILPAPFLICREPCLKEVCGSSVFR